MLERLTTESRNPASEKLDSMSALEIVHLINSEDARVAQAVGREAETIARVIDAIVDRMRRGGRLLYIGAGTSGRLGVLDAAECPPTFNTDPALVIGIIAGGRDALVRAIEGAEDNSELAVSDLQAHKLSDVDVLVGIATSGRTPYVIRGLEYAREIGALAVGLSCNERSGLADAADIMITPVVGSEVLSGSTRMKAGTATKMVLNILTTGTMVRLGKTFGNLMVDLRATNTKLTERSRRIVKTLTGLDDRESQQLLDRCDGEVKTAIVLHRAGCSVGQARARLGRHDGHLRRAMETSE